MLSDEIALWELNNELHHNTKGCVNLWTLNDYRLSYYSVHNKTLKSSL